MNEFAKKIAEMSDIEFAEYLNKQGLCIVCADGKAAKIMKNVEKTNAEVDSVIEWQPLTEV